MTTASSGTSWTHALRVAAAAAAVVGVILLAFAWPSLTAKPHHLPVAVVGTAEQAARVAAEAPPGVLDLRPVADRDEAVAQIQRRQVYGAIMLGPRPEILIASGASSVASQALTSLGLHLQIQLQQATIAQLQAAAQSGPSEVAGPPAAAQSGSSDTAALPAAAPTAPTVIVTDVVPLSPDDPNGIGLTIAGMPLALGGVVGGVLVSLLIRGTGRRLAGVIAYGALGGLVLAGILQGWFGVLRGPYLVNALAIGLGIAATAALIAGLHSLIGPVGIAVGAVITVLVGNPLSSATTPKEFLAQPWGAVGQCFVPGASTTLLRDLSYFPAANAAGPWLVLLGWFLLGIVLIAAGHRAGRRVSPITSASQPAPVTRASQPAPSSPAVQAAPVTSASQPAPSSPAVQPPVTRLTNLPGHHS